MGADILYKSPCCKEEVYTFHEKGSKCPVCEGQEESCEYCTAGVLNKDIYFCPLCGTAFEKLVQEIVDYDDEKGPDE